MRYSCPSCQRVFYLETKTVSPCPACGTMLNMDSDEEAGAAAAPQEPAAESQEATDASWLLGDMTSEVATQATAAPAPDVPQAPSPAAPPTPSAPSGGAPTVQSWIAPPSNAPAPPPADPGSGEMETIGAGTGMPSPSGPGPAVDPLDALNAAAQPQGSDTSGMPAAPRTSRMPAARGPSGSRVFLITSTVVIATAAVALAAIMVFKDRFQIIPQGGANVNMGDPKRIEELSKERDEANKKLATEQQKARDANKARQDLELKLVEANIKLDSLKGRLEKLESSLNYILEAQALFERHSDLEVALSLVDAALKRDPGMLGAWRLKGKILAASGIQTKPALDTFERADKVARDAGGPGDPEALVLAAEVCLTDLGDEDRALGYYKRAAEMVTESPFRLAGDARSSQIGGRAERALAKSGELARAEPSLGLAPLITGEVLYSQALAEKSVAKRRALLQKADIHLAKAIKLDPNSARGCLMRGKLLLAQSKLSSGLGFAMARFGPQSRAERLLSAAKRLKPRVPDVHIALAELSLTKGALRNPAEALQSATEAVRLTRRKSAPALALLAQAHAANGSPAKAVTAIQEAMTMDPKNSDYRDLRDRYKKETQSLSR